MRFGITLLILLVAGLALLRTLPMVWAAGLLTPEILRPDVTAGGTLWDGYIAHPMGSAAVKTSVMPLMTGGTFASVQSRHTAFNLTADIGFGRAENLRFTAPAAMFAAQDPRLAGTVGGIDIILQSLTFSGGGCESAQGVATSDILAVNSATLRWTGPQLRGPVSCDAGDVIITLSGGEGAGQTTAKLRLSPDGRYRLTASVATADARAAAVLPLYGFDSSGGQYTLTERGQWK